MTKKTAWTPYDYNQVLQGDGFYISYNQNTGGKAGHNILTDLGNLLGGNLKDGEETALYLEDERLWLILEGDYRKHYERAFPKGKEACRKVYLRNIRNRSNWSTD